MENRANFGSRLGAILAAAGSAVGLGNIWRFPSETGDNGGAAFILIYFIFIMTIGVPVLIAEMSLGRAARANTFDTYVKLSKGELLLGEVDDKRISKPSPFLWIWKFFGGLSILAGFAVLSYYSVVAGWTLEYTFKAGTEGFHGMTAEQVTSEFNAFCTDPLRPIVWLTLFVCITTGIIIMGVQSGIERASKVMMPLLLLILIVLGCCSLSLPGAMQGLEFLFKPDFSKITTKVALEAMGQAFFTLSVGIGCLMTYASYFSDKVNIVKDSFNIALIDTCVAVLAGVIIFPAAMSVGISPDAGPTLVFITLPNVFQMAFGGSPALGYLVTLMFYTLLTVAALTSSISMLEITTAFVSEKFSISRAKAASLICVATIIAGACCSLGFGVWDDIKVFGMSIFDFFDFFVAKFAMPIGGIALCLLVRRIGKKNFTAMLSNHGTLNNEGIVNMLYFLLKWIIPLLIFAIFINEL